jgi:bifunctional enzyme CysN/CysC
MMTAEQTRPEPRTSHHPLHFATVGSVDDGKSTLIGRLLHDSKSIFEDQLEHISAVSRRRGHDYVDLALLTDGLRAEREQGITIDVAYRYFSTPHRDFVIADCPGHLQYTRNMITGVSRADLAIVLVDARHGIVEQTRRHSLLASLLRVPHLVIAVNKMDLVGHSEERFDEIVSEFTALAADLDLDEVTFIPISALVGDNVVERSPTMTWYAGPTLLHHLETVVVSRSSEVGVRFPVQYVIRPQRAQFRDYRGYAGTVAAGTLRPGGEVVVLPSGVRTTVASIDTADGPVHEAGVGRAVTVVLGDDVDVSRGELLAAADDPPIAARDVTAVLAWMDETAGLAPRRTYTLKHTTRSVRAIVTEVHHRLDVEALGEPRGADTLLLNEIGLVSLRLTEPIFVDDYRRNRSTGSFVLIDDATHQTVAAGMIRA